MPRPSDALQPHYAPLARGASHPQPIAGFEPQQYLTTADGHRFPTRTRPGGSHSQSRSDALHASMMSKLDGSAMLRD